MPSETIVINLEGWKNDFLCGRIANDLCRDGSARILSSRKTFLRLRRGQTCANWNFVHGRCRQNVDAYEIEIVLKILRSCASGNKFLANLRPSTLSSVRTMKIEIKIPAKP